MITVSRVASCLRQSLDALDLNWAHLVWVLLLLLLKNIWNLLAELIHAELVRGEWRLRSELIELAKLVVWVHLIESKKVKKRLRNELDYP